MPRMNSVSQAASLLGKIGRGDSKRRNVDYAELERERWRKHRANIKNLKLNGSEVTK